MQCVDLGGRRIIKKKKKKKFFFFFFFYFFFFFFKQKTAYEISACLVGSEMCIRDSFVCAQKNLTLAKIQKKHLRGNSVLRADALSLGTTLTTIDNNSGGSGLSLAS